MSSRALRKLQGGGGVPALGEELGEESGEELVEPVKPRNNAFNAFSLVSRVGGGINTNSCVDSLTMGAALSLR